MHMDKVKKQLKMKIKTIKTYNLKIIIYNLKMIIYIEYCELQPSSLGVLQNIVS